MSQFVPEGKEGYRALRDLYNNLYTSNMARVENSMRAAAAIDEAIVAKAKAEADKAGDNAGEEDDVGEEDDSSEHLMTKTKSLAH